MLAQAAFTFECCFICRWSRPNIGIGMFGHKGCSATGMFGHKSGRKQSHPKCQARDAATSLSTGLNSCITSSGGKSSKYLEEKANVQKISLDTTD